MPSIPSAVRKCRSRNWAAAERVIQASRYGLSDGKFVVVPSFVSVVRKAVGRGREGQVGLPFANESGQDR